jgi:hypothetical protein
LREEPVMDTDNLLTTTEAAERLGIPMSRLVYLRARHTGPRFVRLGDTPGRSPVRYRPLDLDEYASASVVEPSA